MGFSVSGCSIMFLPARHRGRLANCKGKINFSFVNKEYEIILKKNEVTPYIYNKEGTCYQQGLAKSFKFNPALLPMGYGWDNWRLICSFQKTYYQCTAKQSDHAMEDTNRIRSGCCLIEKSVTMWQVFRLGFGYIIWNDYLCDSFLIEKTTRYDIKGKRYVNSPYKYYFMDLGLRNARINFRQSEKKLQLSGMKPALQL